LSSVPSGEAICERVWRTRLAPCQRNRNGLQSHQVIENWLRLYNRLTGGSYRITSWSCANSSQSKIIAVCTDRGESLIALEHILIEALQNEKINASSSPRGPNSRGTSPVRSALERKLLKLAAVKADKCILLLESNSVTGTIEDQYAWVNGGDRVRDLLNGVDEIWGAFTALLDSDDVIFMHRIYPSENDDRSLCSLNVITGEFWQLRPGGLLM
jgi:hypothetical protein